MDQHYIDAFANALQLSIESPIHKITPSIGDNIAIIFDQAPTDTEWKYFSRIVPGDWNAATKTYTISRKSISSSLITFLLLARLQPQPMKKLAELDPQYAPFITALGLRATADGAVIRSLQDAVRAIFQRIEQQHLTLREVAERADLTQVSLSKFKAGNDIRLSSLLKIAKAVGITIRFE